MVRYLDVRRDRKLMDKLVSLLKSEDKEVGVATSSSIEMASISAGGETQSSEFMDFKKRNCVHRCWRWFKQSRIGDAFREQHLWVSVALRPSHALLSSQDRLLCVLVLILTSMCCSAIFFGNGSGESDIIVTLISSAIAFLSAQVVLYFLRGCSFD